MTSANIWNHYCWTSSRFFNSQIFLPNLKSRLLIRSQNLKFFFLARMNILRQWTRNETKDRKNPTLVSSLFVSFFLVFHLKKATNWISQIWLLKLIELIWPSSQNTNGQTGITKRSLTENRKASHVTPAEKMGWPGTQTIGGRAERPLSWYVGEFPYNPLLVTVNVIR